MSSIDDLVDLGANKKAHLQHRYDISTLSKYEAALRRIVELVKQGKRQPSHQSTAKWIRTNLGVGVTPTTVAKHLQKLKDGESLWPT